MKRKPYSQRKRTTTKSVLPARPLLRAADPVDSANHLSALEFSSAQTQKYWRGHPHVDLIHDPRQIGFRFFVRCSKLLKGFGELRRKTLCPSPSRLFRRVALLSK